MCLFFIHTWIGFLTLKTYLFGMFVLYTKLIGFVNREMKKLKNFLGGVAKEKVFCLGTWCYIL